MGKSKKRRHSERPTNDSNPSFQVPKRMRPDGTSAKKKQETDFDLISQHDYVIHNGFIYVRPYVFDFKCHYKPRWHNRRVFDVFVEEFRHADQSYWEAEFSEGHMLCNGIPMNTKDINNKIWQENMQIIHLVHRHESAVFATKIPIVHDEDGFIVVSKPASMPVHPCGTYRRNTLQFILRAFYQCDHPLLSVHRLDKETSGLVILAKDTKHAAMFNNDIKNHRVQKTYIAQVHGCFPCTISKCDVKIHWHKRLMKGFVNNIDGVDAITHFKVLARNPKLNTTIVECKPITGRTHQIRVHLAHLGFPIFNDRLYGSSSKDRTSTNFLFSPTTSSLTLDLDQFQDTKKSIDENVRPTLRLCQWSAKMAEKYDRRLTAKEEGELLKCDNCPQITNVKNVEADVMSFHLHAYKYESKDWSFQVPLPDWMNSDECVPVDHEKESVSPSIARRMCCIS